MYVNADIAFPTCINNSIINSIHLPFSDGFNPYMCVFRMSCVFIDSNHLTNPACLFFHFQVCEWSF